jgi:hypothetical protein
MIKCLLFDCNSSFWLFYYQFVNFANCNRKQSTQSNILNIKSRHREIFAERPSTQTVIGKTRSRPKPSLRIRKNKINKSKNLTNVPNGSTAAEKPKVEIAIDDEVCGI